MTTIANLQQAFTAGTDQPSALASRQLKLALDPAGEGVRVFLALSDEAIRVAATHADERFQPGGAAGPRALEGITISIKDLFDVAGEVTTAGSTVLRSRAPTTADAPAVARLRAAGAVLFGRTNMVEFAFSGVGINPHYGTPRNRWQREDAGGHVPGGSSSGAGVSVADGMCVAALGTDTGGSVRIPAAFNGLVGFKPTAFRVPVNGAVPLSFLHDSVGPLANSVDCCARIDAVLAGEFFNPMPEKPAQQLRLLCPSGTLWNGLDAEVSAACQRAMQKLRDAGVTIVEARCDALEDLFAAGNLPPDKRVMGRLAETFDWHAANIGVDGAGYDPRVWHRIQLGADVTRAEVSQAIAWLRLWKHRMHEALSGFDAMIAPTVACVPPPIAPLIADDALFFARNQLILRNTAWVNMMDGCALTLPCHAHGPAPVGLQLIGRHAADHQLLATGRTVEAILRG